MKKKMSYFLFLALIFTFMSFPIYAKENHTDKKYRMFLHGFASQSLVDLADYYDQGIIRAGWNSLLTFSVAEREAESEVSGSEYVGYMREGEMAVKGLSWKAVLPDGTTVDPYQEFEDTDGKYLQDALKDPTLDVDAEPWKLDCAEFLVPMEMTGIMTIQASVDGKVIAEFDVNVVDKYTDGTLIRGWNWTTGDRYYIRNDGTVVRGWFRSVGKWYYFNRDGILQTGWQHLLYNGETNWYYFEPDMYADPHVDLKGVMYRGWHKINGTWYFFRKDGSMASNEWIGGYWLSKDGAWKYKAKGRWRKNSKGWWFEDERGWYPKGETVKINNVAYTFDEAGYLVEN